MRLQLLLLCFIATVYSYPSGAPDGACDSLTPVHDEHKPNTGKAPYSITINKRTVTAGQSLTVTIKSANGKRRQPFKGFMLTARAPNTSANLGTFTAANNAKLLTCDKPGDMITHTNNTSKNSIAFKWTSPKDFKGKVVFSATVAKDFQNFWTNVRSPTITVQ